jgi:UDP-N-acetylmuramyl pentapeptide phosphotransferase/UDP-N-acetylglucosamine-1-phosphate transferase
MEIMVLALIAYTIGFGLGFLIWNRKKSDG